MGTFKDITKDETFEGMIMDETPEGPWKLRQPIR